MQRCEAPLLINVASYSSANSIFGQAMIEILAVAAFSAGVRFDIANVTIGMSDNQTESKLPSEGYRRGSSEPDLSYSQELAKARAKNSGRDWFEQPRSLSYQNYVKGNETIRISYQQTKEGSITSMISYYSHGSNLDVSSIVERAKAKYGSPTLVRPNQFLWCFLDGTKCNIDKGEVLIMNGNNEGGVDLTLNASTIEEQAGENQLRQDVRATTGAPSF